MQPGYHAVSTIVLSKDQLLILVEGLRATMGNIPPNKPWTQTELEQAAAVTELVKFLHINTENRLYEIVALERKPESQLA